MVYNNISLSKHAKRRICQRGIKQSSLNFLLEFADKERHVGDHCTSLTLSKKEAQRLLKKGHPSNIISQAQKLAVIEGNQGVIVTVMHCCNKRYRKQMPTYSHARINH